MTQQELPRTLTRQDLKVYFQGGIFIIIIIILIFIALCAQYRFHEEQLLAG